MTITERTRQAGRLPVPMTSFIGRRREITEARQLLAGSRMLTLIGTGGVGKTRLAVQVAESVRRAFRDGVWLVELADLTDPSMLTLTVARGMGLRDERTEPLARLTEYLADKQALIVLDNCEHLPDACASLIDTLLRRTPEVKVLATTRQRLGVEGEQIMQVDPFPTTGDESAAGEGFDAVQLFVERARALTPDFELTDANRPVVSEICSRLEGLPLGIELAAAWAPTLTPAQILDKLSDQFGVLTNGRRRTRPRQRTLHATIDWSYSLCLSEEQALWARLAVFSHGFDLSAVEAVCNDDAVPEDDVIGVLAGLLDKSIIVRLEHTPGTEARYRMLEIIRHHGLERLAESGEEEAVRIRHRDYYRDLAVRYEAECFGPRQLEWLLHMRLEHANLRAAIEFSIARGEGRTALELAGPTYHWISSGYLREGLTWLDRALPLDEEPSAVRAKALWVRSFLAILLGEEDAPERTLAECRVLAEQLERTNVFYPKIGQCSGLVAFMRDDLEESRLLFEEALEGHLRAGPGHFHCAFDCMFMLALIALHRSEPDTEERVQHCMEFCEDHCALWSKSYALWLQAVLRWRRGDPDGALPLLHESLGLQQQVNDQVGLAFGTEVIAWCEAANQRWTRAATLLGAADSVWRRSGANTSYDPMFRFAHDDVEQQVRATLGAEPFAAAYDEWAACSPEEALALAVPKQATEASVPTAPAAPSVLTKRERQIAALVAEGQTNREIASNLVISQRTAECHVQNILFKMNFTSRAQIATWMAEQSKASDGRTTTR